MKVKMQRGYEEYYTINQVKQAKAVIAYEKDNDEARVEDYARIGVYACIRSLGIDSSLDEVLKAEAFTALNTNQWDRYGEGTGYMDIWIEFTAKITGWTDHDRDNYHLGGFVEGGAFLSDIWDDGNRAHVYKHLYAD